MYLISINKRPQQIHVKYIQIKVADSQYNWQNDTTLRDEYTNQTESRSIQEFVIQQTCISRTTFRLVPWDDVLVVPIAFSLAAAAAPLPGIGKGLLVEESLLATGTALIACGCPSKRIEKGALRRRAATGALVISGWLSVSKGDCMTVVSGKIVRGELWWTISLGEGAAPAATTLEGRIKTTFLVRQGGGLVGVLTTSGVVGRATAILVFAIWFVDGLTVISWGANNDCWGLSWSDLLSILKKR